MNDGYWVNYDTDKIIKIDEHERWIRRPGNAKTLGLDSKLIKAFDKYKPEKDRDKFLLFLMQNAPIMRVRGHGNYASFEYESRSRNSPMEAILKWGKTEGAGEYTGLSVTNFATNENTQIYWGEFKEKMENEGVEAVMRVASIEKFTMNKKIAKELKKLAKSL